MVAGTDKLWALWEAYGPPGAMSLGPADEPCLVRLHSLQARPQLNGVIATLRAWDGPTSRFVVTLDGTPSESVKVKAANLQLSASVLTPSRAASEPPVLQQGTTCDDGSKEEEAFFTGRVAPRHPDESFFAQLPSEIALGFARCLCSSTVVALSSVSRAVRAALWSGREAEPLWDLLLRAEEGAAAPEVVRLACPGTVGPLLHRRARGLHRLFDFILQVVPGAIDMQVDGAEVVACPVLRSLTNMGIGAQGVIRRAAGRELEEAVAALSVPVPELSVTLVPGGPLAKRVALTVTEPSWSLSEAVHREDAVERMCALDTFLDRLHSNLLRTVREAGFRSLAMPTLGTGGIGFPPDMVAWAVARATWRDFREHSADPVLVRIACYVREEVRIFEESKTIVAAGLFEGDLNHRFFPDH